MHVILRHSGNISMRVLYKSLCLGDIPPQAAMNVGLTLAQRRYCRPDVAPTSGQPSLQSQSILLIPSLHSGHHRIHRSIKCGPFGRYGRSHEYPIEANILCLHTWSEWQMDLGLVLRLLISLETELNRGMCYQTSNISRTLTGNKLFLSLRCRWSIACLHFRLNTWLASMDWAKTIARQDDDE